MTLFSKHGLHSFAFFLIGLLCFKANAQKPFEVRGKIANLPDGTVITLMKNEGNLLTTVANDTVKAGAFKFSGTINELTEYDITGNGDGFPSTWLELYLKPGSKVSITGSDKLLRTWKVNSNVAEQQDLAQFTAASEKQTNQLQALTAQEYPLFEQLQTASKEKRSLIKRSIDSLRVMEDSLRNLIDQSDLTILAHQTKHGSVWIKKLQSLANTSKYNADTLLRKNVIAIYKSLPTSSRNSNAGVGIYNALFPPITVKIGEKIADTTLSSLDGKMHSLADYKGKYILVDFWSIGCGPCMAAMPEIKKLHDSMSDKVTMVSFNLDDRKENWRKGSEHAKIAWANLSDGKGMTGLAAKYGVSGIPHYILISPEGTLLDSWVGYTEGQLTSKLNELVVKSE